jgi:hypothetical protein
MARYQLRFFFDPGAGTCLWAGNDAARERFNYAIDISHLHLPENTRRRMLHLCHWYDTSIDWNYPSRQSPWDVAERDRFNAEAQTLLAVVREQLGSDFDIEDQSASRKEG